MALQKPILRAIALACVFWGITYNISALAQSNISNSSNTQQKRI
ncbi:hypothetical protein [Chlorogloeopsis sp. ULAP02]